VIEIDGSQYSGSGTIVRQAVAFAALTEQAVHIVNARARRPKPGLRPQHVRVVEAIRELVNGSVEGLSTGSREVIFRPGAVKGGRHYHWDIGSAGSTTNLALAVLPVLAFAPVATQVGIRGGLFQDFAPSLNDIVLKAEEARDWKTPGLTYDDVIRTLKAVCEHREMARW